MSKRLLILMCSIVLIVPLLFMGCGSDGSDGATGATGAAGAAGTNGTNGTNGQDAVNGPTAVLTADSTECTVCHGPGKFVDVAQMHNTFVGQINATVTDVTFGTPVGIQVPVSIFFNVTAADQAGNALNLPLTAANAAGTQLSYVRLGIAKLVPGQTFATSGKDPDQWYDYNSSLRTPSRLVSLGGGNYRYDIQDNVVTTTGNGTAAAAYDPSLRHRVMIIISGLPTALFSTNTFLPAPVENVTFDKVPNGGTAISKNDVTTAGCQNCHFALGQNKLGLSSGAASADFHGGARFQAELCVLCHNPTLGTGGEANLVNLVHKLHSTQTVLGIDYSEVSYPQDLRNCTTCHKGTDTNWNTRPSIEACGACHSGTGFNFDGTAIPGVDFATGVGHAGGPQADNSGCFFCHGATSGPSPIIPRHANENQTPNNPVQPVGLSNFEYGINGVTVAADNTTATIRFWIKQDNVYMNLGDNGAVIAQPAGLTTSPAFLFAYAMAQDGVATPADYTNLGRAQAQPLSVNVVGLTVANKLADNSEFTVVRANAFPNVNALTGAVGKATLRAVGLQGYFTQNGIGRHTAAVQKAVTGDAVRRTIVKSGYVNAAGQPVTDPGQFATATPIGCLECHEVFEGHGGNRVNNVQVCIMCHNPNLSSSGRTIIPPNGTTDNVPINPVITAKFGTDPTVYPEVANGMKELIHGLHAGPFRRVSPWEDIRNRTSGGVKGVFVSSDEITYPGYLGNCAKCHLPGTFDTDLPANLVLTTHVIAPGETVLANINAKRNTVPNADDLVVSPNASACGHCHNSPAAIKHFQGAGGSIKVPRGVASTPPPSLAPDITP